MWVSQISFDCGNALLGKIASNNNVSLVGYPLSSFQKRKEIIVNIAGTIFGKEIDKKSFFKELNESNRIIDFEVNGDFLVGTIKEPSISMEFYTKDIFHIAPVVISENIETMTLGSFRKESLIKAIEFFEKMHNAKIKYIKKKKIKNISIIKQNPDLTDKQKEAMGLAIKHGYYEYPRKIDVQDLARESKLSFSTFHAHLRKAEQKLMPFFFNNEL